jgi:hypothetical protein
MSDNIEGKLLRLCGYLYLRPCADSPESTLDEQNRISVICGNLRNLRTVRTRFYMGEHALPEGVRRFVRKGLEGFSHGAAGAGARKRGAPQSPVFGGAENAPKNVKNRSKNYEKVLTKKMRCGIL